MITQALARNDDSQLCPFRSRPWKARRRSIRPRSPALARTVTDSAKTGGTATLTERDFAMLARIGVPEDLLKEAGTLIHLINSGSARRRRQEPATVYILNRLTEAWPNSNPVSSRQVDK